MTHWGEWGEFTGCSKVSTRSLSVRIFNTHFQQKDKNNEKWQKRKRECWFQGASFSSWKSANKGSKSKTLDDVHCPKVWAIYWVRNINSMIRTTTPSGVAVAMNKTVLMIMAIHYAHKMVEINTITFNIRAFVYKHVKPCIMLNLHHDSSH